MKDSWLTVNPSSGEGNSKLSNSATNYKGRLPRSTIVTIQGQGVSEPQTYKVNQEAYSEYIIIDKTIFDVGKEQSIITVTGKSNSPIIEYSLESTNGIPIVLPTKFNYSQDTISGEGTNGVNIPSDPGSVGEFNFSLSITIPTNTVGDRVGKIKFMGSNETVIANIIINQDTSTYTITYTKGEYIASISKATDTVNYGGSSSSIATLETNNAQYTYTFDGWYSGSTKVGSDLQLNLTSITKNGTYEARGIRTLNKYVITVVANPLDKGNVTGGGSYDYGTEATLTATPVTGYHFTKWNDNNTDSNRKVTVTGTKTYTANFAINIYTATATAGVGGSAYVALGEVTTGTDQSVQVEHGSKATWRAVPLSGYRFDKWSNGSISTSNPITLTVTSDIICNANFIKTYNVITNSQYRINESGDWIAGNDGGTVSGGGTYDYNSEATIKAVAATGYTFAGWYEGADKVSDSESYTFTVTSSRNFAGRFQRNWYTVTFNKGTGISTVTEATRVQYNGSITGTATLLTGYNSISWSKVSGNATTKDNGDGTVSITNVTSDVVLSATASINTYTINYTKGVGIASVSRASEVVNYGGNALGSTATLTTGYSFSGWYDGEITVSSSLTYAPTNVTKNMTLEARATINKYTVNVSAYYRTTDGTGDYTSGTTGGSVAGGGTFDYGTPVTITASAATGYIFDGWYSAPNGGTLLSSNTSYQITSGITSNQTAYARFTKLYLTVNYTKNSYVSSISRSTERVAYGADALGSTLTLPTNTAQYTYSIDGWYQGSTKVSTSATFVPKSVNADVTYEARGIRTINSYTITVSSQYRDTDGTGNYTTGTSGGSGSGGGVGDYGTKKTLTAAPATGYIFDGWYDSSGTRVSTSSSYKVTISGNATYYARFTKRYFTITYSSGNYIKSLTRASERVAYNGTALGSTMTVLDTTAQYSYGVDGWFIGTTRQNSTAASPIAKNVTSDITYIAQGTRTLRSYVITYNKGVNIASVSRASETVNYGSDGAGCTATLPANTAQYTYSFDGWYEGSTKIQSAITITPTNVQTAHTYEARGTATINKYTISVAAQYRNTDGTGDYTNGTTGGTVSGGGTGNYGSTVTITAAPATGYIFDGWSDGNTSTSRTVTITGAATYYARFTKKYFTITYTKGDYVSSISRASERVAYGANAAGSTLTVQANTAQYTYAVDGWYSGSTKVTSSATYAPTSVTADATYTAKGTRSLVSYTITYNKNAYIASVSRASESVNYGSNAAGSTATVMSNTAQYTYTWDGWYEGSTRVSTSLTFAPTSITSAHTYEARANRTINSYTASFSGNGGNTPSPSTITKTYGSALGTLPSCTRNSDNTYTYSLAGWFTAASGGSQISTSTTITGNVTYYAHWNATYINYTITFNGNGGTNGASLTKHYGDALGTLPSSSRTGYIFLGWFTAASGGTKISTSTICYGSVTYYAHWQINTYTVSVALDSTSAGRGSVSGGGNYNYGVTATVTCSMNKTGDVFGGWYNGSTKVSDSLSYSFTVSASVSLTALIYYIDVNPTSLDFKASGGTKTFTVSSNIDGWTIS